MPGLAESDGFNSRGDTFRGVNRSRIVAYTFGWWREDSLGGRSGCIC